jgi:hypothetical protein
MFKQSSDKLNYVGRVASHATKPRASGLIEDIPTWAAEPEAYYNSVFVQYQSLADQLKTTQEKLTGINERLRTTLPFKEYEHLRIHKEHLAERFGMLQQQANSFREVARAAGERSWATVFYLVARRLLPPEDFAVLMKEAEQILERPEFQIKKGEGMKSEESKNNRREQKKRQVRRANWNKHKTGGVTVWADNKPVEPRR